MQLKCSPAFMAAIALPSLLTIGSPGGSTYTRLVKDVLVTQPKIPVQHHDLAGFIDHHLVQFDLSNNSTPPSVIGHLSVHIYHGNRLVQVQSLNKVPDGRTAAVWFSDEILCPLFQARAKTINFDSAAINRIHQGIINAFSDTSCSTSDGLSLNPGAKSCFTCKGKFTKAAKVTYCGDCQQSYHKQKKCSDHNCIPVIDLALPRPPPAGPGDSNTLLINSADTHSRPGRKRSALNTTGFRQSCSRDVRAREFLDSCETDVFFSPPPSPPPPPSEGQRQLRDALAAQALLPVQSSALAHIVPPSQNQAPAFEPPYPVANIIPQKPQRKGLKKPNGPASSPQEIEIELLKRQLVAANTRITSTENALSESKESYSILAKRLNFFEQRENNANISSLSGRVSPADAPPTCSAPFLLTEVSNMKCMLEDLQSSVSILLRAAQHPLPPPLAPASHSPQMPPPPAAQTFPPPGPRADFTIPPPPTVASRSQVQISSPPTMPEVQAAALPTSTPPPSLLCPEAAGQLLPPLIPTPPSIELTRIEDSCLLYSSATSANNAAQLSLLQGSTAPPTSIPSARAPPARAPLARAPPPRAPPARAPPARAPPPRSRQPTRPPSWAEITARRIPPLFPTPVWQPGYAPAVSASRPTSRAPPPTIWPSGSAPKSSTYVPYSSAPSSRPPPRDQRQPRVNPSRSHARPGANSGQGRSRLPRPPLQPTQELLIELN